MKNIFNIYRKNRDTFYNYATGQTNSQTKSRIIKCLLSFFAAVFFSNIDKSFFTNLITIYSILTGFSFSILFFILSMNFEKIEEKSSLEDKRKIKKLNTLLQELFYNVSYFNFLSIALIFITLVSFLPYEKNSWIKNFYINVHSMGFLPSYYGLLAAIKFIYLIIFYYTFLNSIYALLRTTERVFYFFQEKILLKKQD